MVIGIGTAWWLSVLRLNAIFSHIVYEEECLISGIKNWQSSWRVYFCCHILYIYLSLYICVWACCKCVCVFLVPHVLVYKSNFARFIIKEKNWVSYCTSVTFSLRSNRWLLKREGTTFSHFVTSQLEIFIVFLFVRHKIKRGRMG